MVDQAHVAWPWFIATLPLSGLLFALDGILIGAGDIVFMRNVTLAGALGGFLPLTLAAYVVRLGPGRHLGGPAGLRRDPHGGRRPPHPGRPLGGGGRPSVERPHVARRRFRDTARRSHARGLTPFRPFLGSDPQNVSAPKAHPSRDATHDSRSDVTERARGVTRDALGVLEHAVEQIQRLVRLLDADHQRRGEGQSTLAAADDQAAFQRGVDDRRPYAPATGRARGPASSRGRRCRPRPAAARNSASSRPRTWAATSATCASNAGSR